MTDGERTEEQRKRQDRFDDIIENDLRFLQLEVELKQVVEKIFPEEDFIGFISLLMSIAIKTALQERFKSCIDDIPGDQHRTTILMELSEAIMQGTLDNFDALFDKALESVHGTRQ